MSFKIKEIHFKLKKPHYIFLLVQALREKKPCP